MTSNLPFLLFDIGGTNTRISFTSDPGNIGAHISYPTPKNFEDGLRIFFEKTSSLANSQTPRVVAGGIASPLDAQKTMPVNPPNLPGWDKKPLKQSLQEHFHSEVYLENDTALAGLGEASYGAAKDKSIVSYITVSTGVNGVKIDNGRISSNVFGFEIGHQIIDVDSSVYPGSRGELEDFISGREIKKRYSIKPEDLNDSQVWESVSRYLAIALHNTILYWSAEVIVLGGSLMNKIPLESVSRHLGSTMTIFPSLPEIRKSALGNTSVLHGALCLITSPETVSS